MTKVASSGHLIFSFSVSLLPSGAGTMLHHNQQMFFAFTSLLRCATSSKALVRPSNEACLRRGLLTWNCTLSLSGQFLWTWVGRGGQGGCMGWVEGKRVRSEKLKQEPVTWGLVGRREGSGFHSKQYGRNCRVLSRRARWFDLCFKLITWPALWRMDCGNIQRNRYVDMDINISLYLSLQR